MKCPGCNGCTLGAAFAKRTHDDPEDVISVDDQLTYSFQRDGRTMQNSTLQECAVWLVANLTPYRDDDGQSWQLSQQEWECVLRSLRDAGYYPDLGSRRRLSTDVVVEWLKGQRDFLESTYAEFLKADSDVFPADMPFADWLGIDANLIAERIDGYDDLPDAFKMVLLNIVEDTNWVRAVEELHEAGLLPRQEPFRFMRIGDMSGRMLAEEDLEASDLIRTLYGGGAGEA